MGRLEGKIALVTGGGRGIGRGIVERLAAEGAAVTTCGRGARPDDLSPEIDWITADVAKTPDANGLVETVAARHGRLDILVNNAGVQVEKTVVESSDADWDLVMGVNAKGVFNCCRAAIPVMAENGGGAIVNIGSIAADHADPQMALYDASKGFVHGLTRAIAVDHGAEGIRCNAVCPGWIMTAMADAAFELARDPAAAKKDALARHPVGRFGRPEDIANAVLWLASDEAAFASGQTFVIDGGIVAATPIQPGLS